MWVLDVHIYSLPGTISCKFMFLSFFFFFLGFDPDAATKEAISFMLNRVNGCGGAIVLNKLGQVAVNFSTERMAWAWQNESSLHFGLNPTEHFTETLNC